MIRKLRPSRRRSGGASRSLPGEFVQVTGANMGRLQSGAVLLDNDWNRIEVVAVDPVGQVITGKSENDEPFRLSWIDTRNVWHRSDKGAFTNLEVSATFMGKSPQRSVKPERPKSATKPETVSIVLRKTNAKTQEVTPENAGLLTRGAAITGRPLGQDNDLLTTDFRFVQFRLGSDLWLSVGRSVQKVFTWSNDSAAWVGEDFKPLEFFAAPSSFTTTTLSRPRSLARLSPRTVVKDPPECQFEGLQRGQQLGKGSYKTAFELLCSNNGASRGRCDAGVLLVAKAENEGVRRETLREIELMRALQATPEGRETVMPIRTFWECPQKREIMITQPRAVETLLNLGARQAFQILGETGQRNDEVQKHVLFFTRDQLRQAFQLARRLYELRVPNSKVGTAQLLHGDLHPGNIFVLSDGTFRISDLGFTGAWRGVYAAGGAPRAGFSHYWFGCPKRPPISPILRRYYNVWQLEAALRAAYITFVQSPTSDRPGFSLFEAWDGIDDLYEDVEEFKRSGISIPFSVHRQLDQTCETLQTNENRVEKSRRALASRIRRNMPHADIDVSGTVLHMPLYTLE